VTRSRRAGERAQGSAAATTCVVVSGQSGQAQVVPRSGRFDATDVEDAWTASVMCAASFFDRGHVEPA
jgi:hypothetical protein